jgi:hypothetical protein
LEGSSYVSLFDTLLLEKIMQSSSLHDQPVKLPWVSFLLNSHPSGLSHGNPILSPNKLLNGKDYRLLWILSCLVLNNNILWNLLSECSISTEVDNWTGWLLKYLCKNILYKKPGCCYSRYTENIGVHKLMWTMDPTTVITGEETATQLSANYYPIFSWRQLDMLLGSMKGFAVLDLNNLSSVTITNFMIHVHDPLTKIVLFLKPFNLLKVTNDATFDPQYSSMNIHVSENIVFDFSQVESIYSLMNNTTLSNVVVPLAVLLQDRMFELWCAMNSTENSSPCADWDVYSKLRRVFTEDITTFWNVGRHMRPYISVEDNCLKLSDFHLIAYVKSPKMSNIQQNYLFSMGN